jgi:hypothetical protein
VFCWCFAFFVITGVESLVVTQASKQCLGKSECK